MGEVLNKAMDQSGIYDLMDKQGLKSAKGHLLKISRFLVRVRSLCRYPVEFDFVDKSLSGINDQIAELDKCLNRL